jgi:hypothetical protein
LDIGIADYAIPKGKIVKIVTRRIPGLEKAILGAAFVGTRVFLHNSGAGDRRNDQRIYREST